MINRRAALASGLAMIATPTLLINRSFAAETGRPLPIPPVMDIDNGAGNRLTARRGRQEFLSGAETPTLGYDLDYLGPTLRMKRGQTARLTVGNSTDDPITAHWHGAHVSGNMDGGPQTAFRTGDTWNAELDITQPAATLWMMFQSSCKTGLLIDGGAFPMMSVE